MEKEKILKIEGTLDRIFYPKYTKKVESGKFAIFRVVITKRLENCEDEIEDIKIKGNVCSLEYGTTYKIFAKLVETHEIYGNTYDLVYISKCIDISSKDKQKEFLKNVLNENLVEKLFDEYDDVIKLLEEKDIKSLMKIKGIGNQVALKMIDEYEESKDYSAIYMELGQLGLTHTFIKKLVDFYHSPDIVIDVVRNNPYDLVRVDGVGFKKADEVACKVGIGQYDICRIKGFLLHHLNEQGEAGKSYLNYQELMKALYDTLGFVPEEIINTTAKQMIESEDVVALDNGSKIALKRFYNLEKNIMTELLRLQIGKIKIIEENSESDQESELHSDYIPKSFNIGNWDTVVKRVEEKQGFTFTEEQRSAIKLSLDNHVMALTGLAGAGKTSTANGICSLYDNYNILACALSGKASVRITEATGLPASTIHRALGYQNEKFIFNKENKLAVDIVLIDEATMINGTLFLSLLEAIPTGAKVIIMGDVQQLTPIGNCQVFADILDSNVLPVVKLTKPHRQALMSGIIPTSIKVANQEQIFANSFEGNEILGKLKDMELDVTGNKESRIDSIISHFQTQMDKYHDIIEVQICVPMRLKGELSCYNLNTKIQDVYNPKFADGNEIEILLEKKNEEVKKYLIRVGDKVLNTKNNYKCTNADGDTTPVFNGNIGIVKEIEDNGYCTIDFVGIGEVVFSKTDAKNLELAYACTIHKCITEDTWLYTSNGLMQLKDFNNNADEYESKKINTSVKVFNGEYMEIPENFYNAGISKCKKITTQRGYSLTATEDHRLDVLCENSMIECKHVSEISNKDYVVVQRGSNVYGNTVKLPSKMYVDENKLDIRVIKYKTPKYLTNEFARFLGYMVANGVICKSGLKYGKNHKNVVIDFENTVYQVFGYKSTCEPQNVLPNGRKGGMYLSEINSVFIREFCKKVDGIQPNDKYVPKCILSAPKQYQIEFLRGVFEDGTVCLKRGKFDHISFAAKEELLINQVQMMLLNMGIITTKYPRVQNGFLSFTLYIYGKNCDRFIKNIGFISNVKVEKSFKYYEKGYLDNDSYTIPYITKIIRNIINDNHWNISHIDSKLSSICSNGQISYMMLGRFLNYCKIKAFNDKRIEYLTDIYNNTDIEKINTIEEATKHTYCIEMPISHKFIQNGIRGWNCQGSGFTSTIVGMDTGSYIMNNSELLYTAITRAKKYCVLVGNNYAISKAIQTKEVKTKQTFLRDMLLENSYRLKEIV